MGESLRRLSWPLALAVGAALAWGLVRVIKDPALRRAMVADRVDDPGDLEEREILRERMERAQRQPAIPFDDVFPEREAPR